MNKFIFGILILGGVAFAVLWRDPAATAESPRAEASAIPAPAAAPRYDQVVINTSNFQKNEFGTVEGSMELENLSGADIKDVVLRYDSIAASGTVLKSSRATLYRTLAAHSKTVFSITPVTPLQTETVRFEIESYTQTH